MTAYDQRTSRPKIFSLLVIPLPKEVVKADRMSAPPRLSQDLMYDILEYSTYTAHTHIHYVFC